MKILVTSRSFGAHYPEGLEQLREHAEVIENPHGRALTREELIELLPGIKIAIIGHDPFDREVIEHASASDLKLIARHGVGTDNIDLEAANERGILVTYTPGANAVAVAEHTITLIMALLRNLPAAHHSMTEARWECKKFIGHELMGKTLGIIGLGAVGYEVALRLGIFGLEMLIHDPFIDRIKFNELDDLYPGKCQLVELEEVLTSSDIITIHCALTEETRGLISSDAFGRLKASAIIINTARAEIVDLSSLLNALKERRIAGVALDVYEHEPPKEPELKLREFENVILTPHIAAYTVEALRKMDEMNVEDVIAYINGQPLYHKRVLKPEKN